MTTSDHLAATLAELPVLAELFRIFLSGKHLNRVTEPALWAALEGQAAALTAIFAALGFELRLDVRGFAWFHSGDASSEINKLSRQFALLFMVIFDAQANTGKALQHFTDWQIDSAYLTEVYKQQQALLDAEGLSPDAMEDILGRACTLGFATTAHAGWRLLPAVHRYLDHFQDLAVVLKDDGDETGAVAKDDMGLKIPDDEESG